MGGRSLFAHIFKHTAFGGCQQDCFNLIPTKADSSVAFAEILMEVFASPVKRGDSAAVFMVGVTCNLYPN